jgi:hypothetical protein
MIFRSFTPLFAFIFLSCVYPHSNAKAAAGQIWTSPDRIEFFISYTDKNLGLYLNNDASRLCYSYIIPGKWLPTDTTALLQAESSDSDAGVILYSASELKDLDGPDLVTRAAKFITQGYAEEIGKLPASVKIVPFELSGRKNWKSREWSGLLDTLRKEVPLFPFPSTGAIKWTAVWYVERAGQQYEVQDSKILVEIAPGWVAQITAGTTDSWPPFDDGLARSILETLNSTSDKECFWPFIRKHYPLVH